MKNFILLICIVICMISVSCCKNKYAEVPFYDSLFCVLYTGNWQDSIYCPVKKDSFILYSQIVKGNPVNFIFIADDQNIYSRNYSYVYAFHNYINRLEIIGMGNTDSTNSYDLIYSDSIVITIDSNVFTVKVFEEPSSDMLDKGGTVYINKDFGIVAGESTSRGFSMIEKNSMVNDSVYCQIRNKVFDYISRKRY